MPEPYFSYCSGQFHVNPSAGFKDTVAREFYMADAYLKGDLNSLDLTYTKSRAGSLPIFKANFRGRAVCGVQRSWQDIRKDSKHFCLIWFPTAGTVHIHQNGQGVAVRPDQFAITYADRPLRIEATPDQNDVHESYQVAVPLHLMNTYLPHVEKLGGCGFELESGNATFAKRTCIALFEEAESMSARAIDSFVAASLAALSDTLNGECEKRLRAHDIKTVRLKTLRDYIDFHLSDPGLTGAKVAEECGISPRYMHLLFREAGTTFGGYTWNNRLRRAHDWLTIRENQNESISHIAFTAGYRSVSHFSRSFKAAYGYTPTEARASGPVQRPAACSGATAPSSA